MATRSQELRRQVIDLESKIQRLEARPVVHIEAPAVPADLAKAVAELVDSRKMLVDQIVDLRRKIVELDNRFSDHCRLVEVVSRSIESAEKKATEVRRAIRETVSVSTAAMGK